MYIAFCSVLVLWKGVLYWIYPYTGTDSAWSLGPAFSVLRGDVLQGTFSHYHLDFVLVNNLYSIVSALYFIIVPASAHSMHLYYLLLLVAQIILLDKLCRSYGVPLWMAALIVIGWTTSNYSYGGRYEALGSLFLLLVMIRAQSNLHTSKKSDAIVPLLVFLAGMVHPVAGVVALFAMFRWTLSSSEPGRTSMMHLGGVVLLLGFVYVPLILVNVHDWWTVMYLTQSKDNHGPDLWLFFKYLVQSPSTAVVLLVITYHLVKQRHYARIAVFIGVIVVVGLFGRSYYHSYTYLFLISGAVASFAFRRTNLVMAIFMTLAPAVSHYLPTYRIFENLDYASSYREVLTIVDSVSQGRHAGHVYVTPQLAMGAIDKPYARMMYYYYREVAGSFPVLSSDDLFLVEHRDAINGLREDYVSDAWRLKITELRKPVQGLLRYPYTDSRIRSDSLGLWLVEIERGDRPSIRDSL